MSQPVGAMGSWPVATDCGIRGRNQRQHGPVLRDAERTVTTGQRGSRVEWLGTARGSAPHHGGHPRCPAGARSQALPCGQGWRQCEAEAEDGTGPRTAQSDSQPADPCQGPATATNPQLKGRAGHSSPACSPPASGAGRRLGTHSRSPVTHTEKERDRAAGRWCRRGRDRPISEPNWVSPPGPPSTGRLTRPAPPGYLREPGARCHHTSVSDGKTEQSSVFIRFSVFTL